MNGDSKSHVINQSSEMVDSHRRGGEKAGESRALCFKQSKRRFTTKTDSTRRGVQRSTRFGHKMLTCRKVIGCESYDNFGACVRLDF